MIWILSVTIDHFGIKYMTKIEPLLFNMFIEKFSIGMYLYAKNKFYVEIISLIGK